MLDLTHVFFTLIRSLLEKLQCHFPSSVQPVDTKGCSTPLTKITLHIISPTQEKATLNPKPDLTNFTSDLS